MNNLTSDKNSTYPILFWISLLTFSTTLFSMFIFEGSYSEKQFNFLWGLGVISIISTIICSRFPSCKSCGKKTKHNQFSVHYSNIETLRERYFLKKPFQYENMKASTADWTFHVLTCENCNYNQVVTYYPDNFGN